MRNQRRVKYARYTKELIHKVRVALADAQLDGELNSVVLNGLALDVRLGQLANESLDLLARAVVKVQNQQVWHGAVALCRGNDDHDHANDQRADQADVHEPRAERKALADRPEHVDRVDRVLDGRAETDDGQRADHAEGERQVRADEHNHQRGDHG